MSTSIPPRETHTHTYLVGHGSYLSWDSWLPRLEETTPHHTVLTEEGKKNLCLPPSIAHLLHACLSSHTLLHPPGLCAMPSLIPSTCICGHHHAELRRDVLPFFAWRYRRSGTRYMVSPRHNYLHTLPCVVTFCPALCRLHLSVCMVATSGKYIQPITLVHGSHASILSACPSHSGYNEKACRSKYVWSTRLVS